LRGLRRRDHPVVVVEFGALGAARVQVVADGDDAPRVLVGQLLQTLRQVRVDAADEVDDRLVRSRMHQGYPGLEADDGEVGPVHYAVAHAAAPFDGETEGQPGLGDERRAGTPGLARSDAVHRAERPGERLAGAVAVAHRDV